MLQLRKDQEAALLAAPASGVSDHVSAKLALLLEELGRFQEEDPGFKVVVFSQWTSFLNIIQVLVLLFSSFKSPSISTFLPPPHCRRRHAHTRPDSAC